jgi:hypothetical protein
MALDATLSRWGIMTPRSCVSGMMNMVTVTSSSRGSFWTTTGCLRPRVNHLLRCLPPRLTSDLASQHDSLMLSALSHTLDTPSFHRPSDYPADPFTTGRSCGLVLHGVHRGGAPCLRCLPALATFVMSQIPPVRRAMDSVDMLTRPRE